MRGRRCETDVTPEAALGGPLAVVQNGDRIRLDVANRSLTLLVPDEEIARRLAAVGRDAALRSSATRGYAKLFRASVTQADQGCDFDFLRSKK